VECIDFLGFPDGGQVINTTSNTNYAGLCFEYEDEQGNDCSTITLAAGEERTCTVKNYIRFAFDNPKLTILFLHNETDCKKY
jgi:hypothetical protein